MNPQYTPEQLSNINLQSIIETNTQNTLRMSEALRATVTLLKTFDGNPNHLEAFINIIDIFYNRYYIGDESQKEFVNLAILSKLTGEANSFILTRPDLTTWPVIRDALRLKFGDPISRQNLTQQLMFSTRNRNESTLDYVNRLKTLVHRITSKIQSENLDSNTKLTLIEQTELTATHNLMSNVPQELKTILIIQNPTDLTTAQNLITNYEMINNQITFKSHFHQVTDQPRPAPMHKPIANFTQPQPPRPFPSQPILVKPQMSKIHTQFPTNRQVFGKPQNVFKPTNNHSNFPKPTPMSGVSIQPRRPINQQGPSNPRPFNSFPNHNNYNNRNYWRNNPHANPLVFQEITHLENPEATSTEDHEIYGDYDSSLTEEYPREYHNQLEAEHSQSESVTNDPVSYDVNVANFPVPASEEQYHA